MKIRQFHALSWKLSYINFYTFLSRFTLNFTHFCKSAIFIPNRIKQWGEFTQDSNSTKFFDITKDLITSIYINHSFVHTHYTTTTDEVYHSNIITKNTISNTIRIWFYVITGYTCSISWNIDGYIV